MRRLSHILGRRRSGLAPLELTPDMRAPSAPADRRAGPNGIALDVLSREVADVAAYVARLKREAGAMKPNELRTQRLPALREDMRAAGSAAQAAAERIVAAAEAILSADRDAGGYPDLVRSELTDILEACSFQDIVGQRLSRAVASVEQIERRVVRFSAAVPIPDVEERFDRQDLVRETKRELLLVEGPAESRDAVEQGAIDKLFA